MAYGGLGDSSGMRHVRRRGSLLHADSSASRITADQVCPSTPANNSFLSKHPITVLLLISRSLITIPNYINIPSIINITNPLQYYRLILNQAYLLIR